MGAIMRSFFSCVRLCVTQRIVACQALLSIGFSSMNTEVGCHDHLQCIFPTHRSNLPLLGHLHWQQVLAH